MRIRDDPELSDMPIILISGVVDVKELEKLLDVGVSRFLTKPAKKNELHMHIADLLYKPSEAA